MTARGMRWIGLALLGLAVAAAVAYAGSSLVSREIGLASEPLDAGDSLAPRLKVRPPRRAQRHRPAKQVPAKPGEPVPEPVPAEPEPVPAEPGSEPAPAETPPPRAGSGDGGEGGHGGGESGGGGAGGGGSGGSDD